MMPLQIARIARLHGLPFHLAALVAAHAWGACHD